VLILHTGTGKKHWLSSYEANDVTRQRRSRTNRSWGCARKFKSRTLTSENTYLLLWGWSRMLPFLHKKNLFSRSSTPRYYDWRSISVASKQPRCCHATSCYRNNNSKHMMDPPFPSRRANDTFAHAHAVNSELSDGGESGFVLRLLRWHCHVYAFAIQIRGVWTTYKGRIRRQQIYS
jgi:hypothetical protein